jgi:methylmalonyl-CoA/ethylmalonyl-CoA epimerase
MSLPAPIFEFHHLGIAVRDLHQALPFYENVLGYRLTVGPIEDPIQCVSVCFLERSSPSERIELVAPAGGSSPIQDILRKGSGPYHTCYQVSGIDAAIEFCQESDCVLVSGPVPAAAFNQRRIAWLFNDVRHLIELVEAPPATS